MSGAAVEAVGGASVLAVIVWDRGNERGRRYGSGRYGSGCSGGRGRENGNTSKKFKVLIKVLRVAESDVVCTRESGPSDGDDEINDWGELS